MSEREGQAQQDNKASEESKTNQGPAAEDVGSSSRKPGEQPSTEDERTGEGTGARAGEYS